MRKISYVIPGVAIVPISHAELDRHAAWDYGDMWRQADNIYYRWYLGRSRVEARRYAWFDYDTWCNQSAREFFAPVWNAPFACANHFTYKQHPKWTWFNKPDLLPYGEQYRSKEELCGVVPLCGVFLSRETFATLVEEQLNDPATWRHVFSELRLGTILRKCAVPILKNPNASGISALGQKQAMQLVAQGAKTIVHPIKAPVPSAATPVSSGTGWEKLPAVSCMCLTYGRPHLLAEAIESFLRQDYAGPKEMVVLNDLDCQTLRFNHPEVRIINVAKRFRTVGEKRNACAALATHDLLFVWDDDDIYLPHRLHFSVEMFDPKKRFFKPRTALALNNGMLDGPHRNLFHSGSCWTRSLFDEVGGYAHMNSGQDLEIEQRFANLIPKNKDAEIRPQDIFYIYRWAGTGSFHLSGFGTDKPGQMPGIEKVGDYVAQAVKSGRVQTGLIDITPRWACDYARLAAEYGAGQSKPPVSVAPHTADVVPESNRLLTGTMPVEVVVLNWRRPDNVRRIVAAFRQQREHCTVTLIDAAHGSEFAVNADTLRAVDRYFLFSHNFSGYNRFIPLASYTAQYTYFHDDDMLPGPRTVAAFLRHAESQTEFAVLGQEGRILRGGHYKFSRAATEDGLREVDFVVRGYFVRTVLLQHFLGWVRTVGGGESCRDEDLLLCSAARQAGFKIGVMRPRSPLEKMNQEELPSPHSISAAPGHFNRRDSLVQRLQRLGWRTVERMLGENAKVDGLPH